MSAIKSMYQNRLINDIKSLHESPIENMNVYISDDDMLTWNCLIIGCKGTCYEGGEYIAKMAMDNKYPMTAPEYYVYTPNGRYKTDTKICLSNSKFHKSDWNPGWNIQLMMRGWQSNMVEEDDGTSIGHIKHDSKSDSERKKLAAQSIEWNQKHYPDLYKKLKEEYIGSKNSSDSSQQNKQKFPKPQVESSDNDKSDDDFKKKSNNKKLSNNTKKKIRRQRSIPSSDTSDESSDEPSDEKQLRNTHKEMHQKTNKSVSVVKTSLKKLITDEMIELELQDDGDHQEVMRLIRKTQKMSRRK
jgi:ubiquitin-conjugating enzyme E2 J2